MSTFTALKSIICFKYSNCFLYFLCNKCGTCQVFIYFTS